MPLVSVHVVVPSAVNQLSLVSQVDPLKYSITGVVSVVPCPTATREIWTLTCVITSPSSTAVAVPLITFGAVPNSLLTTAPSVGYKMVTVGLAVTPSLAAAGTAKTIPILKTTTSVRIRHQNLLNLIFIDLKFPPKLIDLHNHCILCGKINFYQYSSSFSHITPPLAGLTAIDINFNRL